MAIQVWTPADGFTRKPVIVKPTVEKPKPKPPAQPSTRKRLTPSALKRQRACWLKQNQITARTIADDYLIKQAKTATPREFYRFT